MTSKAKKTRADVQKELEETRAKITQATDELEQQLEIRLEQIRNWQESVKAYPLESVTVVFGLGFILGSGIIAEILQLVFPPSPEPVQDDLATTRNARNKSKGKAVMRFARPVLTSVAMSYALKYAKKRT